MKKTNKFFFLIVISMVMMSCATPAERRRRYISAHPEHPAVIRDALGRGAVVEGMTKKAVRLSWGKPKRSYRKKYGSVPALHWEYNIKQPDSIDTFVLVFRKGILISLTRKHSRPRKHRRMRY